MAYTAAVITVSDSCSNGIRADASGPEVARIAKDAGFDVIHTQVIPDDMEQIKKVLIECTDELNADIVLTTGGTGFSKRDVTPEATKEVIERETPFIPLTMLYYSLKITPNAMLSRMTAGIRGNTIIINLPGSPKAAAENLGAVIGTMEHALGMLHGDGH